MFISVILRVKDGQFTDDNILGALAIGMALWANIEMAGTVGGVSGAAFNPMVVTCQNTYAHGIVESDPAAAAARPNQLLFLWDFWLGDLVAAIAAAIFFRMEQHQKPSTKVTPLI
jgi:glycerol uptake facilitator-like aquaporin